MRITVKRLTEMWRAAADAEGNPDKAEQLRACAKDLERTHFYHEIVVDPKTKLKFWRLK